MSADSNHAVPRTYEWFSKLKLTRFIPWEFDEVLNPDSSINRQFERECNQERAVLCFGRRQDTDTFAGFEVAAGEVTEKVLVFHLSFAAKADGWNVIESEHADFFEFMQQRVLPDMKAWIPFDDVDDYHEE